MKIRDWKELNGVHTDDYTLWVSDKQIAINLTYGGEFLLHINIATKDDKIIAILKLFGFDIEFPEPQKLNKRERSFCEYVENGWIARDNKIMWYREKPTKSDTVWSSTYYKSFFILADLFQFIQWSDDEPHSVEEMLSWEVSE